MPKVNIYLPDALAEAVKAEGISVSPVCQRALEQEVTRLKATATAKADMKKAAARLRGTVDDQNAADQQDGFEFGAQWAKEAATYMDLVIVVELPRPVGHSDAVTLLPEETQDAVCDFMGEDNLWRLSRRAFFEGFVAGAKVVLDEVRPLL